MKLATDVSDIELALKDDKKTKMGRPTICSFDLTDKICELIAKTPKGLLTIIKQNPWMPGHATLHRWQHMKFGDPVFDDFRDRYAQAQADQIQTHLNYTYDISDKARKDVDACHAQKANAYVQLAKLRIETRQKYAEMLVPKKYGKIRDNSDDKKPEQNLTDGEALAKAMGVFAAAKEREEKAQEEKK